MLKIAWYWMFALLPLPVLVRMWIPKRKVQERSLKIPFFRAVSGEDLSSGALSKWIVITATVIWILLVLAASRPIWIDEKVEIPVTGRDMLVALDISGSMQQQNFSMDNRSRFETVREMAGEFVSRRVGDRVGLILFGSLPYLYAPLTFDVQTVVNFLEGTHVGFAGQRTAIGDTIGLAVKVLRERSAENRILILLTDGENSAGSVEPLQALQLAVEHGVRIFVIGIGLDHSRSGVSSGSYASVLPQIAESTGGVYFHASDASALKEIYEQIDAYEPIEAEPRIRSRAIELYPWPLALALCGFLLLVVGHSFMGSRLNSMSVERG